MAQTLIKQIRGVIGQLRPDEVNTEAQRPLRILLQSTEPETAGVLEDCLFSGRLGQARLKEAQRALTREDEAEESARFHLVFFEAGLDAPEGWKPGYDAFPFHPRMPGQIVDDVLAARPEYALALARRFKPFHERVTRDIIQSVSRENAMFAIVSALPNVIPSLAEVPWVFGEFASDTAVLTVNQIRMAFRLAAASDQTAGFTEQRNEIGSILAGAFGWRSLAREFSGKIPFGGGLVPKAAIAYAGTWVAGASLERLYSMGYGLSRQERKRAWDEAFTRGKEVAAQLLARLRRPRDTSPEPVAAPAIPEEKKG